MFFEKHGESSRSSPAAAGHVEEDDQEDLGLDDLMPEPESPVPPPYSFATYDIPDDLDLPLPSERSKTIITRLVGSHPLWAHHLWNTSIVLADYLLRHPELVKGKKILELGAGAGLPSIVCALSGADQVVVTDYPDKGLIDNIEYNLDLNLESGIRERMTQIGFLWGANPEPIQDILTTESFEEPSSGYDLLLLSDLVFNHSQHAALVASVNSLLSNRTTPKSAESLTPCILVFITHHRPHLMKEDLAFFDRLAASGSGWAYEQVVENYVGSMFPDDRGDERVRGTVKGWRCWRVADGEQAGERPRRI